MTETKSRRRGEALERAILDAAWEVLREVGYGGLTMEAVAARAATSKPVIYRRWPSRAALVIAAWDRLAPVSHAPIDTGTLRSDLFILFTRIGRRVDRMMSETIAGVMGEALRHPELAEFLRERLRGAPVAAPLERILRHAADRGELLPVRLPARVARTPVDLIRNEAMTFGAPVSSDTIAEIVDEIFLPLLRGLAGMAASATDEEPTRGESRGRPVG